MGCRGSEDAAGDALVAAAAAVAIQMAQGRTADELELISAFFEVLGDNLSLIAAQRVEAAAREERRKLRCGKEDCPVSKNRVK